MAFFASDTSTSASLHAEHPCIGNSFTIAQFAQLPNTLALSVIDQQCSFALYAIVLVVAAVFAKLVNLVRVQVTLFAHGGILNSQFSGEHFFIWLIDSG